MKVHFRSKKRLKEGDKNDKDFSTFPSIIIFLICAHTCMSIVRFYLSPQVRKGIHGGKEVDQ